MEYHIAESEYFTHPQRGAEVVRILNAVQQQQHQGLCLLQALLDQGAQRGLIEDSTAPNLCDYALVASLAAREVIVATLAQIYAASDEETSLRSAVQTDVDPRSGKPVFTPATVASLLVFFVFALQCMSTIAVTRSETRSWRWTAFQFGYLGALAWLASFLVYQGGLLLGLG